MRFLFLLLVTGKLLRLMIWFSPVILALLLLFGCGAQEPMDQPALEDRAVQWYEYRQACLADNQCTWVCNWRGMSPPKYVREGRVDTMEKMVKGYQYERHSCGALRRR